MQTHNLWTRNANRIYYLYIIAYTYITMYFALWFLCLIQQSVLGKLVVTFNTFLLGTIDYFESVCTYLVYTVRHDCIMSN